MEYFMSPVLLLVFILNPIFIAIVSYKTSNQASPLLTAVSRRPRAATPTPTCSRASSTRTPSAAAPTSSSCATPSGQSCQRNVAKCRKKPLLYCENETSISGSTRSPPPPTTAWPAARPWSAPRSSSRGSGWSRQGDVIKYFLGIYLFIHGYKITAQHKRPCLGCRLGNTGIFVYILYVSWWYFETCLLFSLQHYH